jgi:hypothetical protein
MKIWLQEWQWITQTCQLFKAKSFQLSKGKGKTFSKSYSLFSSLKGHQTFQNDFSIATQLPVKRESSKFGSFSRTIATKRFSFVNASKSRSSYDRKTSSSLFLLYSWICCLDPLDSVWEISTTRKHHSHNDNNQSSSLLTCSNFFRWTCLLCWWRENRTQVFRTE